MVHSYMEKLMLNYFQRSHPIRKYKLLGKFHKGIRLNDDGKIILIKEGIPAIKSELYKILILIFACSDDEANIVLNKFLSPFIRNKMLR